MISESYCLYILHKAHINMTKQNIFAGKQKHLNNIAIFKYFFYINILIICASLFYLIKNASLSITFKYIYIYTCIYIYMPYYQYSVAIFAITNPGRINFLEKQNTNETNDLEKVLCSNFYIYIYI